MKPAAIGLRMHSGWGAMLAVSNQAGNPEVIARRRIAVSVPGAPGGSQPYHFAKSLELAQAEKFLADSFVTASGLAASALEQVVGDLKDRYRVVGCGVLLSSARPLPALAKILSAHPLLHSAEGEFFRQAVKQACESLGLAVSGFRERDLDQRLETSFGRAAKRVNEQISSLGRSLGPPWTTDQKMAAAAALLVLAGAKSDLR